MTDETGKLYRDGLTEVELCAQIFEYTARNGPTELADKERTHSGGSKKGRCCVFSSGRRLQYSTVELPDLSTGAGSRLQSDGWKCSHSQACGHLHG